MSEVKHLKKLFADLYDGVPWTEVKLTTIITDITSEQAAKKIIPEANSIWQLVQHCLGWRDNVLRKLQGEEFKSPEDNYLSEPTDTSADAWNQLLAALAQNNLAWQHFLQSLPDESLDNGYAPAQHAFTQYAVIHGILHHDNYHIGQVLMLKKLVMQQQR